MNKNQVRIFIQELERRVYKKNEGEAGILEEEYNRIRKEIKNIAIDSIIGHQVKNTDLNNFHQDDYSLIFKIKCNAQTIKKIKKLEQESDKIRKKIYDIWHNDNQKDLLKQAEFELSFKDPKEANKIMDDFLKRL